MSNRPAALTLEQRAKFALLGVYDPKPMHSDTFLGKFYMERDNWVALRHAKNSELVYFDSIEHGIELIAGMKDIRWSTS